MQHRSTNPPPVEWLRVPQAGAIDKTAVIRRTIPQEWLLERKPKADDDPAVPGQDKNSLLALEVL
jgi:hypothetical protein